MTIDRISLEAIEAVYRARGADFLRVALARTRDFDRAHDAVQEGFARAIRNRRSFVGSGSLEAWICRCVLNAAHDLGRETSLEVTVEEDPSVATEADAPDEMVRAAVLQLPQRQRDALFLRYYLDFDYAQIAEALGVRVGTVSATLHAARAALGQALMEVA
ncbi:MAG: sigma-70 family RNA polymerase sigma factor [Actinobacteria bacterium]|nr:sigma-70 family RNA polymerase sigma factor [Actinomycetota bacterium]